MVFQLFGAIVMKENMMFWMNSSQEKVKFDRTSTLYHISIKYKEGNGILSVRKFMLFEWISYQTCGSPSERWICRSKYCLPYTLQSYISFHITWFSSHESRRVASMEILFHSFEAFRQHIIENICRMTAGWGAEEFAAEEDAYFISSIFYSVLCSNCLYNTKFSTTT